MTQAQTISVYQPTLQSLAYKMLGCMADAEDAVQEVFTKWLTIDTSSIENVKAYLVRMVKNLCLNILQSKREKASPEILEEIAVEHDSSFERFDVESQFQEAWKFLHRKLEPVEKTVFLLREVFDVEYQDLQFLVDKKADNCRKIVSRAKEKLKNAELPKLQINLPEVKLMESFKTACEKGNLSQLVQDFTSDIFNKKK